MTSPVTAALRLVLYADNVAVVESTDQDLWQSAMHAITADAARIRKRRDGRLDADEEKRVKEILQVVSNARGVSLEQLIGRRRQQVVTRARFIAMYLLRIYGLSYPTIGSIFKRDHASVMNGVSKIEALLADSEMRAELAELSGRARLQ